MKISKRKQRKIGEALGRAYIKYLKENPLELIKLKERYEQEKKAMEERDGKN